FLVTVTLPYIIYRIYTIQSQANQSDTIEQAIVNLIGAVAYTLFYLNYAGSFYLFLISSERFRRQVKYIVFKKYWRMYCQTGLRNNHIAPISHISSVELD
ncbi:unnamed protein product, partial [Adineta steineri]